MVVEWFIPFYIIVFYTYTLQIYIKMFFLEHFLYIYFKGDDKI